MKNILSPLFIDLVLRFRTNFLFKSIATLGFLDDFSHKLVYATAATAATAASFQISENVFVGAITIFLAIIGWFIKITFDSFREQIKENNDKLDKCILEMVKVKENFRAQDVKMESWRDDKREIFERLKNIEVQAEVH